MGAAVAVCLVQAGALIYFLRLLRLEVPDLDRGGSVMHLPSAVAAAAVAGAGGWVSLSWGARSPASLLVALAAVGLGFLAYAALNWRWLGPLRARPGSSAGA